MSNQFASIEEFFDESYYAFSGEAKKNGIRPIDHYLQFGEQLGAAPSTRFDPKYYLKQYPDLGGWQGGLLNHYLQYGRAEGRQGVAMTPSIACPTEKIDPGRATILLAVHDASRSGAPILAWNLINELRKQHNVVVLLKSGGPIEPALREAATELVTIPAEFPYGSGEDALFAQKLTETYSPLYAIANSVATRELAILLEAAGVPVIALVHEFSSYFQPIGILNPLYVSASKLVFPAPIVADASVQDYPGLKPRHLDILPQGPSKVPSFQHPTGGAERRSSVQRLEDLALEDTAVILGTGRIEYRKGVDAFIAAASQVQRSATRKFKFVWIGHLHPSDASYFGFLQEQIKRSGLEQHVLFVDEVDELEPFYSKADVFFLSSRLDPLPNVAIDASLRKIPVVCFKNASGFAELLECSDTAKELVVPYLDSSAAGRMICDLLADARLLTRLGEDIQAVANATFDMGQYARKLDQLGRTCAADIEQMALDQATILESGIFNASLRFGSCAEKFTPDQAVNEYLNASRLCRPLHRGKAGMLIRRPVEGFHPLIYAAENPEVDRQGIDPLAHFLRNGRPEGRWTHRVIRPEPRRESNAARPRIAIHGHFYYPDLLESFLKLIAANASSVDLFLTTSGPEQAAQIRKSLRAFGIQNADVWSVPNRGRDIGPFLKEMPDKLGSYDIVGHFHGKRSKHVDSTVGDQWRDFAWQHLIGDAFPMIDVIADAFAEDAKLGLVFAEDPYLNGWDENRDLAERLAQRMKIEAPLPEHFDFPIGTMFWARVAALQPLFQLNLDWNDYPHEPLPIDGTILHALERIVPFAVQKSGFEYATTYVRSSMRDDGLAFIRRPGLQR
ncbi:rhamnan synthesis F family protein [Rhodopseudomonas palustris]|uniref:Glycosyl transferase, group 1 n=1 Tax=Rhodopseudomonas palustris (strain BisB18) TaxID=316056 RepID=Q20YR5_RHOPB